MDKGNGKYHFSKIGFDMSEDKKTFLKEITGEENLKFETDPVSGFWQHSCRYNGNILVSKGSACSWCGQSEDGSFD